MTILWSWGDPFILLLLWLSSFFVFFPFKVCHFYGSKNWSKSLCPSGRPGWSEPQNGHDSVCLPHGERNEESVRPSGWGWRWHTHSWLLSYTRSQEARKQFKPFQSFQLGDIIQDSKTCMLIHPGSLSCIWQKVFPSLQKTQPLTNIFLSLNLLLLWKSREKNNLFSRHCSCLLPLVKYRSCCVINFNIIFQTSLMWLHFCKVRAIRGVINPVLQPVSGGQHLIYDKPLLLSFSSTPSPCDIALHPLRTMPSLAYLCRPSLSLSHLENWQISQAVVSQSVSGFSSELSSHILSVFVLSSNRKASGFLPRIWAQTTCNTLNTAPSGRFLTLG